MCFVFLALFQGAICFLGGRLTHDFIMGWYESSLWDGESRKVGMRRFFCSGGWVLFSFRWVMRRRTEPRCGSGFWGFGPRVGLLAFFQHWAGGRNAFGVFSWAWIG
ncbi:MAG: hypothetical protein EAZ81_04030 [Verrucomicrobia bacterium]|nr:MAG: hypothetical protein EAZ81_04030 [Verrucomicrobiota bacterium]